jgi:hypothetical protein
MCVWRGGGGGEEALAETGENERGMENRLEGDDAVNMKTGLIYDRPLQFESITFLGKNFQPMKSPDLIGRIFVVQLKARKPL